MATKARRDFPIPPGVAAVVSNGVDKSIYALYKDHQIIVIQLPLRPDRHQDVWAEFTQDLADAAERRHQEELQKIQGLLDRIEFGKSNWVYAVQHPKGGYELVHKTRRKHQLTCHTWARLIPRRDVTFTKFWISDETWHGYWNGHEVDVLIGLEDRTIANLDRQMWAYLALQGLDLTYHVYGHLVDDDGTIVGLVQEPHVGRLMQYRDRSIVYDAYSRLQQRGLIYCGAPDFCNTHIMDGKVRFTVLYTIWHFPDKEKCQFQANLRHWKSLQGYFKNLKNTQDVPARQCLNRIWDRVPQLLPCFGPVPFKLSPLNLVVEEPEARYRDIRAWLRKTEHSRKRLAVLDQAMPLAQGGVVRRERIHRIDESWALDSRDMPRSRRRDALTSSYEVELLEHGSHLSDIPIQRRRTMPVQTSLSDSDSEKTIVDFVSALAANAQFTLFTLHEKDEDQGWVSESSGDGTLVASEAFSTHLS